MTSGNSLDPARSADAAGRDGRGDTDRHEARSLPLRGGEMAGGDADRHEARSLPLRGGEMAGGDADRHEARSIRINLRPRGRIRPSPVEARWSDNGTVPGNSHDAAGSAGGETREQRGPRRDLRGRKNRCLNAPSPPLPSSPAEPGESREFPGTVPLSLHRASTGSKILPVCELHGP